MKITFLGFLAVVGATILVVLLLQSWPKRPPEDPSNPNEQP
jgi:hypothetical protein